MGATILGLQPASFALVTGMASLVLISFVAVIVVTVVVNDKEVVATGTGATEEKTTFRYPSQTVSWSIGEVIEPMVPMVLIGKVDEWSVSPDLPAGISMSGAGVIAGTPTAAVEETPYVVNDSFTINITVHAGSTSSFPPVIDYNISSRTIKAGETVSMEPVLVQGNAASSYSIAPSLPLGMTFNTTTGEIAGSPTLAIAATAYSITPRNTGGEGTPVTLTLTVTVDPPVISYPTVQEQWSEGVVISSISPTLVGGSTVLAYSVNPALPLGVSIDSSTGVISGTPTTYTPVNDYEITPTNGSGSGPVHSIKIGVDRVLGTITYPNTTVVLDENYAIGSILPTQTGGSTIQSYRVDPALPAGITLTGANGLLSGRPTVQTAPTTYHFSGVNQAGVGPTFDVLLSVVESDPQISYATSSETYGETYAISSESPTLVNGTTPVSYAISPALPAGLTLNTSTGVLSGTPTETRAAQNYTITASSAGRTSAGVTISIAVITTVPNLLYPTLTESYNETYAIFDIDPIIVTGSAATSFTVDKPLPPGISLNASTGRISGTSTTRTPNDTYTFTASNSAGSGTTHSIDIEVLESPPVISYSTSTLSLDFNYEMNALPVSHDAGSVPVSYSVSPGLPSGLSLNTSTGEITGRTSALASSNNHTITATNGAGSDTFVIAIEVVVSVPDISYSSASVSYTEGIVIPVLTPTLDNGSPVLLYTVTPALPAGLGFDNTTGAISGTPNTGAPSATYAITGTSADGVGPAFNLTIDITYALPDVEYYSNTIELIRDEVLVGIVPTFVNGTFATSYAIFPTTLPLGLAFNTSTGEISGTPTANISSTAFTITATNPSGAGAPFNFTISVETFDGVNLFDTSIANIGDYAPILKDGGNRVIPAYDLDATRAYVEATPGQQFIHVKVFETTDGELVCAVDDDIGTFTNTSIDVSTSTLANVKTAFINRGNGALLTPNARVPTLAEYYNVIKQFKILLFVDVSENPTDRVNECTTYLNANSIPQNRVIVVGSPFDSNSNTFGGTKYKLMTRHGSSTTAESDSTSDYISLVSFQANAYSGAKVVNGAYSEVGGEIVGYYGYNGTNVNNPDNYYSYEYFDSHIRFTFLADAGHHRVWHASAQSSAMHLLAADRGNLYTSSDGSPFNADTNDDNTKLLISYNNSTASTPKVLNVRAHVVNYDASYVIKVAGKMKIPDGKKFSVAITKHQDFIFRADGSINQPAQAFANPTFQFTANGSNTEVRVYEIDRINGIDLEDGPNSFGIAADTEFFYMIYQKTDSNWYVKISTSTFTGSTVETVDNSTTFGFSFNFPGSPSAYDVGSGLETDNHLISFIGYDNATAECEYHGAEFVP